MKIMVVWPSSLAVIFLSLCSNIHSLGPILRVGFITEVQWEKETDFSSSKIALFALFCNDLGCLLSPTGLSFRYRHTCWLMHLPLTWYLREPSAQCPGDWEQILIYSFFSPQGTKPARASLLSALCSTDPGRRFPADPEEAATAPAASHRKHCAVLWQATPQCQVISHLKPGMTRVIKSGEHNRWMRLSSN